MAPKRKFSTYLRHKSRTPSRSQVNRGRALIRKIVFDALSKKLGTDVARMIVRLAGSPGMSVAKYNAWKGLYQRISYKKTRK